MEPEELRRLGGDCGGLSVGMLGPGCPGLAAWRGMAAGLAVRSSGAEPLDWVGPLSKEVMFQPTSSLHNEQPGIAAHLSHF